MAIEFYNRNWRMANSWNGTEDNNTKFSNYSMSFDGTGDKIQTTFTPPLADNSRSISIWFYTSVSSTQNICGYGAASQVSGHNGFDILTYTGGYVGVHLFGTAIIAGGTYNVDSWNHYVITYNGTTLQGYLNGVSVDSNNTEVVNTLNTNDFIIGQGVYTGFLEFSGKLDHCSIFDYALSQAQVTELYGSSSTGVGNPMAITNGRKPIAYYPLGDYSAYNGTEYLVANSALSDYVFDFDGSNSINFGTDTSLNITSSLSVSVWFKTSVSGTFKTIINKDQGFGTRVWQIGMNLANNVYAQFRGDSTAQSTSPSTYADGNWHNLVAVYNSSTSVKLYIDGVLVNTENVGVPSSLTDNSAVPLYIGGYSNYSGEKWNGEISNAAIFNTALPATGTESVESLYNYGTPPDISSYSGLQGFWKLDASATFDGSNWSIPDSSSNSNTGTSSGMTAANLVQASPPLLVNEPYSRFALDFDGSSEYINFNSSTELDNVPSNPFSFSFWFKSSTAGRVLSEKRVANNFLNAQYTIHLESGYIKWYGGSDGVVAGTQTSFTLIDDKWHHIVCVAESTTVNKIYVDGQLNVTSSANRLNSSVVAGSLRIGANFSNAYGFIGSVSNYSIWNAALNSTQVTEIYNNGLPSNLNNHSAYSNLVSWWQLGENSSFNSNWTVIDEKGTNNGTSANMAEDDLVNGVGTTANGLSSGMGGADNINGDAPYSTSNALSYGMGADAKSTSVPT